jgi:hypothetical protein
MAIQPDKGPEKIPPPREGEQKPRFQQPPKKKFDDQQVRRDKYPPDSEVVRELKKRAQSQQPPPPPPRRQVQQEGPGAPAFGQAIEEELESVDQRPPPSQPKPESGQKQQLPVKEKAEEAGQKLPAKEQKKEGKAAKGAQQQAPQQVPGQQMGQGVQAGAVAAGHVAGAGTGTNIEQIINVFQTNPIYGSHVQALSVQARGADTEVAVMMANGVNVNVTVMAGGKDLNVVIRGITAEAQAALDNPANQALLASKLAEKGFVVHQMRTFRGEEPTRPASEAGRREREEAAGEGGPGEEKER